MVKCSNEIKTTDEKIQAVAQKYFNDFIVKEGTYRWAIDKEMKKVGLSGNDNFAETCIMKEIDALVLRRNRAQELEAGSPTDNR